MIDEKKLIEELEKKPFIHGRYDHKNGNIDFISGIETWHETVMHEIENAPKVGEWIPCSERLPEEGKVLLTINLDGQKVIELGEHLGEFEWCIYDEFYDYTDAKWEVIAWMHLPEPYKGE